jgi:micrococcal nuclease
LVAVLLVVLSLSRCGEGDDGGGEPNLAERAPAVSVQVVDVIDGDTIEVELSDGSSEHVRYIGIDTPETAKPDAPAECAADQAEAVNESLVGEGVVRLRFGPERRDDYGRLLAYVYVPRLGGGLVFVNAELMRRGLARPLTISPNDSRAPLFERLASSAGRAGRGLWGNCPL